MTFRKGGENGNLHQHRLMMCCIVCLALICSLHHTGWQQASDCFIATGVEVSLKNLNAGMKLSWPTYTSGFQILINGNVEAGSTWAFAQAFHWSVWLVLGATAASVGIAVAGIESAGSSKQNITAKWHSWLWVSAAKVVMIYHHVGDPRTWVSKIVILAYGFLVLIMINLYTSKSATYLSHVTLRTDIHSKADLLGRSVATWDQYASTLKTRHGIAAQGLPW